MTPITPIPTPETKRKIAAKLLLDPRLQTAASMIQAPAPGSLHALAGNIRELNHLRQAAAFQVFLGGLSVSLYRANNPELNLEVHRLLEGAIAIATEIKI